MIQRPLLDAVRRVVAECTPRDCRECNGSGLELAGSNDDVVPCSWCGGDGRNYSGQGAAVADVIETCVARGILPASVMDDPRRFACSECGCVVMDVLAQQETSTFPKSTMRDGAMYSVPSIAGVDAASFPSGTFVSEQSTGQFYLVADGSFMLVAATPCAECSGTTTSALPLTVDAFIAWASLGFGQPRVYRRCDCVTTAKCPQCRGTRQRPVYGWPKPTIDGPCDVCAPDGVYVVGMRCDCADCDGTGSVCVPVGIDTAEALAREVVGALREYGHRGSVERVVWRMNTLSIADSTIVWQNGGVAFGEDGNILSIGGERVPLAPWLAFPSAAAALVRMGLRFGPIDNESVTILYPPVAP